MDITEIRRENLRRWVAEHGTPSKEKSLFSQLKANGSFGERVARRLEEQYRMGAGYLDKEPASGEEGRVAQPESDVGGAAAEELLKKAAEMIEIYRLASPADKQRIDLAFREARRNSAADQAKPRAR